jgi:hypothetical protein
LLELVEATFNDVAVSVGVLVEGGWTASVAAAAGPVSLLVAAFGDGVGYPASPQVAADLGGAVALVGNDVIGSGSGATGAAAGDVDGGHDLGELGAVVDVSAGEYEPQRPAGTVTGEVDLAAQSTSGSSKGVIRFVWFGAPFLAPAAC